MAITTRPGLLEFARPLGPPLVRPRERPSPLAAPGDAVRSPDAAAADPADAAAARRAAEHVFTALHAAHGARIHRFLRDLLGDVTLASDATQETFVRAFRQRDTFDGSRNVAPWLFGIARNVSLEIRRARARARRVIADDAPVEHAPEPRGGPCPEGSLLGREALAVVGAAMDRLTEERRAMLLLRLDHGLSYDEIADLMAFSVAKVKVEIFRARELLRETMAGYERGDGT